MLDKGNEKPKKINQKINNFFKKISNCIYLSSVESNIIIKFIKEVKNYFSDILFYINKNNEEATNNIFENIFEKTSDNLF